MSGRDFLNPTYQGPSQNTPNPPSLLPQQLCTRITCDDTAIQRSKQQALLSTTQLCFCYGHLKNEQLLHDWCSLNMTTVKGKARSGLYAVCCLMFTFGHATWLTEVYGRKVGLRKMKVIEHLAFILLLNPTFILKISKTLIHIFWGLQLFQDSELGFTSCCRRARFSVDRGDGMSGTTTPWSVSSDASSWWSICCISA